MEGISERKHKVAVAIIVCLTIFTVAITMLCPAQVEAASKPSQVKSIKVSSRSYNSLKISWKKTKGAKGYQIYRATSKNGKYKKLKTTKSTSYTNNKLSTGKRYYYKVRAYNGKRKGKFSAKRSAIPTLSRPTAKAVAKSSSSVQVSWNKISGAKGYQLYRATSKSGKYTRVKTTSSRSYTNSGLTASKTYYYKVRAYRKVGKSTKYSSFAAIKGAKTKAASTTTKPTNPTKPTEPTPNEPEKVQIKERKDCYLPYGNTKIWIGQDWTDTVNASLNGQTGGAGPVAVAATRYNVNMKMNERLYVFDTGDYSNFLMVCVVDNKIREWSTTADNAGTVEGVIIKNNEPESTYANIGDPYGVGPFFTISEYMVDDAVYSENDCILSGVTDNTDGICYTERTSIIQEERIAEHVINALRAVHGLPVLNHNDTLYDASGTYGTKAYAMTMAASDFCSHIASELPRGPLAGTGSQARMDLILKKTGNELAQLGENAAGDFKVGELVARAWYRSSRHKGALLETTGLQNYNQVSEMAVAGADRGDGYVYWAFQNAAKKK